MATAMEDFSSWLSRTLEELNTDESVFGSYIQGILDSDESCEEKSEALQGILSEIIQNEDEINKICNEILEKWQFHKRKEPPPAQSTSEDVDTKLVKLLESQSLATTKQKKYTEEEKKIREAILMQYSQMTDDEDEAEDGNQAGDHKENGLEKNTNVQSVLQAEKVKREQAKLDSQRKKEKDKEDREKQKQLREEKKEKRKTQKGERRR
ncbi:coiled-coil domain-containing protein 43 [Tribolium castaneum]|uniref:Coiled-coil domain-containing protein 43 n=1 Tax=Tribolium castaneum TaxID=7070 RepID=D6WNA8_TRICA|nr:PREDICTED: coiled-coil domain-containing protein 43 [Tribolium castaneum]EFA03808.1 Coiled-coil domain-containing protein 43-like Protein [Tribolium castaneum]|eukprot:XP_008192926.1 PREDICTED: coiled-coil domain-containing protein 43 [Tribolium castaneum]